MSHRSLGRFDDPYYRYNHEWHQRDAVDLSRSYDDWNNRRIDDDDGNHRGGSSSDDSDDDDWHAVAPTAEMLETGIAQADLSEEETLMEGAAMQLPPRSIKGEGGEGIHSENDGSTTQVAEMLPGAPREEAANGPGDASLNHSDADPLPLMPVVYGLAAPLAVGLAIGIMLLRRPNRLSVTVRRSTPAPVRPCMSPAGVAVTAVAAQSATAPDGALLGLESK